MFGFQTTPFSAPQPYTFFGAQLTTQMAPTDCNIQVRLLFQIPNLDLFFCLIDFSSVYSVCTQCSIAKKATERHFLRGGKVKTCGQEVKKK
jgi:hypothetical protein